MPVGFLGVVEDVPPVFLAAPELHLVRIVDGRFHTKAALFREAPETVLGEEIQVAGRVPLDPVGSVAEEGEGVRGNYSPINGIRGSSGSAKIRMRRSLTSQTTMSGWIQSRYSGAMWSFQRNAG